MEIIAHRGASHDAPENTLAAARLAWVHQADALECDVHLTRDNRLAVIHDDNLGRVASDPARVADLTLAELRRFDVGVWKNPGFRGEKIPALDELLAITPADRRVFVELKGGPPLAAELARTVARADFDEPRLVVISFDLNSVAAAKRALPRSEACWIVDRQLVPAPASMADLVTVARQAGIDGLDLDYRWPVDAAVVTRARAAGLSLYVWTVDDAEVAYRLFRDGVGGVATNRPGWLRAELARLGAG